jgi:hypothetical protein
MLGSAAVLREFELTYGATPLGVGGVHPVSLIFWPSPIAETFAASTAVLYLTGA